MNPSSLLFYRVLWLLARFPDSLTFVTRQKKQWSYDDFSRHLKMEKFLKLGTFTIPGSIEVTNTGLNSGHCDAGGGIGDLFMAVLGPITKVYNCTITEYEEIGSYDFDTNRYTHLIGGVESGEIDVSLIPVYYPLIDKGEEESFHYSPTIIEDEMTIITAYNVSHTTHMSDVLFMYRSIPSIIWIGVMVTFISLVTIMVIGQKLLNPKSKLKPATSLFSAFINQNEYSFNTYDIQYARFLVMLSLFISTFVFFTDCYIGNSVSTDLVVIDKANAPTTYEEIIERRMLVGFTKMLPEYEKFRDSPPGSAERRLYDQKIFMDVQAKSVIQMKDPLLAQKAALVGRPLIAETVGRAVLAMFANNYPDIRGLMVKDPKAKRYTNVFALNAHASEWKKLTIRKLVNGAAQGGIINFLYKTIPEEIVAKLIKPITPTEARKLSPVIEEAEVDLIPVGIENSKYLFTTFACMIALSATVLLSEMLLRKRVKKRSVKVVRFRTEPVEGMRIDPIPGPSIRRCEGWKPILVTVIEFE